MIHWKDPKLFYQSLYFCPDRYREIVLQSMFMVMQERVGDLLLSIRSSNLLQVLLAAIPGSRACSFPLEAPSWACMRACVGVCLRKKGKVWVKRDSVCVTQCKLSRRRFWLWFFLLNPVNYMRIDTAWRNFSSSSSSVNSVYDPTLVIAGSSCEHPSNQGLTQKRKVSILILWRFYNQSTYWSNSDLGTRSLTWFVSLLSRDCCPLPDILCYNIHSIV